MHKKNLRIAGLALVLLLGLLLTFGGSSALAGSVIESPWRPFKPQMAWRIPVEVDRGEAWTVFVQFRDAAGNESDVVTDSILYLPSLQPTFLPMLLR